MPLALLFEMYGRLQGHILPREVAHDLGIDYVEACPPVQYTGYSFETKYNVQTMTARPGKTEA